MKIFRTKSGYEIIWILSGRSNVFLLTNKTKNILIDTSTRNNWKRLLGRLDELNISKVDYLILTHTHFDHAANAKKIKHKFNATIIVHQDEVLYLTAGQNVIIKGTNCLSNLLVSLIGKTILSIFKYEPCSPDLLVDKFIDLNQFGFNASIIHTPGHSIGSMSVIVDDEIALVGDAMFGVFKWSVIPPFAQDFKRMITSWGVLLKTNCYVFIPSHGTANSRYMVQKVYSRMKHRQDILI